MTSQGARPLRAVIVEDEVGDEQLIVRQLKSAGFDPVWTRVDTEAAYLAALDPTVDIVLTDFNVPGLGAPRAMDLLRKTGLDVPLIVVSGSIGEETAVQVLQAGAVDYLLKDRLARLGPAVHRALEQRRLQRDKQEAEDALRAAEERTRFALQAARVGVWETDLTTGAARWSETLEALHGMPPGAFGGTFTAFLAAIDPRDREGVRETIAQATASRQDSNILYRASWPDGSLHWISGIGRTFSDAGGSPVRAAGIGIDVTERRALEEQYRQSQKMEAIGQLAGGVAHDFNNLLTAILGYCQLATERLEPDDPLHRELGQILHASNLAAALTRQLLAFSRRQILETRVLDLRDSLAAIEPMLRRLIAENIEVVVRAPATLGYVSADPTQVEQVILNLALNARDAMPQGGLLMLEVADAVLDESYARQHPGTVPGPYVMLALSDTGAGMDPSVSARIFDPFFTTKERGKGTGLGLSTVYGVVKQSGGNIWHYSEPGHGTTFKVYFPRHSVPAEERDVPAPVAVANLRGSETILVVEDANGVRLLIQTVLERQGYRVLLAATPEEALAHAADTNAPLHLLLSDIVLPQMSGVTLADRIRAAHSQVRVLFMSGYTDNAIVHGGVLNRGIPFLQKPFTPDVLARKVREVLERQ